MLSYDLVICNHPPPSTQVSVGELFIQGIERHSGEEPFSTGKAFGGPKSYDSTETVVLYITYYTPFSASVVQWKENFFCSLHKMTETGELFVVRSIQTM